MNMKKTLIAAGVAAAMAVPAIAAADVSLTAQLQAELVHLSGDGDTANGKGLYIGDAMSGGAFNSGNYSRVDLRASHDLGNGLTGLAHAAMNLHPRSFPSGEREITVGLRGDFGTVRVGRMTTQYATAGKDPFNATFMQARGNGGMLGGFGGLGNGAYLNNAIDYSGKFGMIGIAGTWGIDSTEDPTSSDTNAEHAYALQVTADFDPVNVWVAFTTADEYGEVSQTGAEAGACGGDGCDFQGTKVGAEFKTGPFGVMGQWENIKHENTATGADTRNAGDYYMLAGTYRMGANTFMLGFGQMSAELDDADQQWIALGMRHAFSRQVSIHGGVRQTTVDVAGGGDTEETAVGAGMRVVF
jgi:predicted porin